MSSASYSQDAHRAYLRRLAALRPVRNPDATRREAPVAEWLGPDLAAAVRRWAAGPVEERPWATDDPTNTPGSRWLMSDPVATFLGRRLEAAVSGLMGRRTRLSQGSVNVWSPGVPLVPHRDLFPDGHLVLIWTLLYDGEAGWPIYLDRPDGTDAYDSSDLARGLLFASGDVLHWRDPFPGRRAVTAILRYTFDPGRRRLDRESRRHLARHGQAELEGAPPSEADARRTLAIIDRARGFSGPGGASIEREWLSPADVERILALGPDALSPPTPSKVLPHGESEGVVDASHRESTTRWLLPAGCEWLIERLSRTARQRSAAFGVHDHLVHGGSDLVTYAAPSAGFGWHADTVPGAPTERRRLSISVLLSAAERGGLFELDHNHLPDIRVGDAVIFRPDILHRVTPVERGTRVSLISWFESPLAKSQTAV